MRIIFIRHGDPNYENDCLTEKGEREAKLLAKRVAKWENISGFTALLWDVPSRLPLTPLLPSAKKPSPMNG